ncbi:MAG: hypothetical protein HOQ43_10810 [Glycomyces artemisiae]|uniref:Holliday junction resolvase RusA-like endonuclease n=1 Tax=Glycomyces artemisiae TaxID=1076443 RepID=A0A850CBK6_9ACTN|nr:hypothetical protein [Glycomyces artemisiae]
MSPTTYVRLAPVCACARHLGGHLVPIPAPTQWLTSNGREHRQVRARMTKLWRQAGRVAVAAARLRGDLPVAPLDLVHVTAYIRWRDRRRRDPANWWPTVKAIADGMTDAGVWPDDDSGHVIGPDMRAGLVLPRDPYGPVGEVIVHIVPLGGES